MIDRQIKLDQAMGRAKKLAEKFNDEIGIIKNGDHGFTCVRGKAYEANIKRYTIPLRWVKPCIGLINRESYAKTRRGHSAN